MAISTNCWKYLVLVFNVLFAMSAVVLFGASGYLLYRLFVYRHFIGVNVEYPAMLLVMMAIITCSVAWIGWTTARTMHRLHIIITGILIVLVVVIEFSCFVWAMVVWDSVDIDIKNSMTTYFNQVAETNQPDSPDAIRWDRLHVRFECCGVSGPSDYGKKGAVPFSCCGQGPLDAQFKPYASDCAALYQRGCGKPLHEYTRHHLMLVAMTALSASVLQRRMWLQLLRLGLGPVLVLRTGPPGRAVQALRVGLRRAVPAGLREAAARVHAAASHARRNDSALRFRAAVKYPIVAKTALFASVLQSTGVFCTFFLAAAIQRRNSIRRGSTRSLRTSTSVREATFAAPDDSLLSPTAPAATLPKY